MGAHMAECFPFLSHIPLLPCIGPAVSREETWPLCCMAEVFLSWECVKPMLTFCNLDPNAATMMSDSAAHGLFFSIQPWSTNNAEQPHVRQSNTHP